MANLNGYVLTSAGKNLFAKSNSGECKVVFTKAKIGEDETTVDEMLTKSDLVGTNIKTMDIVSSKAEENKFTIITTITNTDLEKHFYIRQLGVFAKGVSTDGLETEVVSEALIAVAYDTNPDVIPAASTNTAYTKEIDISFSINNADDCEITISWGGVVTVEALENHNSNTDAHLDMKGATEEEDGVRGMVPKPSAGEQEMFLRGDGKWASSLTKADLLDMIYPVGSIYMSVNSTSPDVLFGGTWEEMPAGRVLLAQGTSDWETTYTAGETGGEATHQLTVGEMPSHNHSASTDTQGDHQHSVAEYAGQSEPEHHIESNINEGIAGSLTSANGSHSHNIVINNTGGNEPHNNMQPYVSCYMWKRIA